MMKCNKPADRIANVSEYYFSVKLKEIAKMNAEGADIINLGIGSPDLPPAPEVIEALSDTAANPKAHGYQSYIGTPELRSAFATWYKTWYNVDLDPSTEILPLMGSKEGIMHISMAFVNPGDSVLVPNPGYPTYTSVSKLVGANIIYYNCLQGPDFEELEARHERGEINLSEVKLLWCNFPNMPTGTPATRELLQSIVDFGRKWGIIICHDNPYSFILNDHPLSILEIEGAKDCCIELNSLSKSHNMPGWRIGCVSTNAQFLNWILRVKSNMDSGMFRGLQMAAAKALSLGPEWYKQMNEVYGKRRAKAEEIMAQIGAEVAPGQQGLFLWGKVQGPAVEITDKVLYGAHVFLTPGFIFGSNGENYVRISLCANEEMLQKALERIQQYGN